MKQQRIMQREYNSQDCIISFLYIKPQLPPYWLFRDAVVLYRFSTSNHNCTYIYALVLVLYYIVSLHQTTTERALNRRFFCCIISFLYIKPQPHTILRALARRCIISFLYIKPQQYLEYN